MAKGERGERADGMEERDYVYVIIDSYARYLGTVTAATDEEAAQFAVVGSSVEDGEYTVRVAALSDLRSVRVDKTTTSIIA